MDGNGMDVVEVKLLRGEITLIDAADLSIVGDAIWRKTTQGYAGRTAGSKTLLLHREIMGAPPGLVVDHRNHNRLDNRRENLRVCPRAGNSQNSTGHKDRRSRFKGVEWDAERGRWAARICANGVRMFLGRYDTEVEAAMAYNAAARDVHGDYAWLNKIEER
jgi:hypothetical protein